MSERMGGPGGGPIDWSGPNDWDGEPTLADFLLARIAEDEQNARDRGADAMMGGRWKRYPEDAYVEVQSLTLAHSKRTMAECEAKRRIVEDATPLETASGDLREVVRLLATIYADHPDFREEWRA